MHLLPFLDSAAIYEALADKETNQNAGQQTVDDLARTTLDFFNCPDDPKNKEAGVIELRRQCRLHLTRTVENRQSDHHPFRGSL